jgi:4,5-epoxidase
LHGDRMFALFPLPGADVWRVLVPQPGDEDGTDRLALVLRLLTERTGLPAGLVTGCVWTSGFRIHRRLAEAYRAGHVLLAGDAAHIHSPFGGQGMNTGLGDAENLAWKLALVDTGSADEALLDTYQAERRPIATEVLGSTSSMTQVMLGRTTAERLVRDHVVVPLMNRRFVQRRIAEASSQLRVSYRTGPLGSAYPLPGPRAGDRLADLPCTRADGTPTRLHAELRGRWAVVSGDAPATAAAEARLGAERVVRLRSAAVTGTVLVRPDGHIACRGGAARISRWLDRALGAPAPRPVAA